MNLYREQFDPIHNFSEYKGIPKFLVIASTPRSGSSMLGHLLHSTGHFGYPLEYFQHNNFSEWKRILGTTGIVDTLQELIKIRTSPNGVFGIKLHYSHIRAIGGSKQLNALFPNANYVLVSRSDAVAQAVSYAKAAQTGVWIKGQQPISENPEYNFDLINKKLLSVLRDTNSWRYLLSTKGFQFTELVYERVLDNVPQAIKLISNLTGVSLDIDSIPNKATTTRQSESTNTLWSQRFKEEHQKLPGTMPNPELRLKEHFLGLIERMYKRIRS